MILRVVQFTCLVQILQFLSFTTSNCECFAPTRNSFLAFPYISTSLLVKGQNDDKSDDSHGDNQNKHPRNDLDIFGQSKTKQSQKNKNSFFLEDDEAEIPGPERIKSCIPYALVLIDGDSFGKYIYERIPPIGMLDYITLRPFVEAIQAAPFLGILLFMVFAIGPQFAGMSREIRFNAQQAVLMDVLLIFPEIIGEGITDVDVPRSLLEPASNFVWIAYMTGVIYCVLSNLRGKKPNGIPFVSSAAEYIIGPF